MEQQPISAELLKRWTEQLCRGTWTPSELNGVINLAFDEDRVTMRLTGQVVVPKDDVDAQLGRFDWVPSGHWDGTSQYQYLVSVPDVSDTCAVYASFVEEHDNSTWLVEAKLYRNRA